MKPYTIKKGNFYCEPTLFGKIPIRFGLKFGNKPVKFTIRFDESCLYKNVGYDDQINKIAGYSTGLMHQNSIGIGWNCDANGIYFRLWVYGYIGGVRQESAIITSMLKPNQTWTGVLTPVKKGWWGYYRYFYFGGNIPAPQTMIAWVERS